jgi:adenosylmethionine---8-amino-7-oxononanoate aminotransferase
MNPMPSASSQADLVARDLAHVWHPCTQMKDHEREMPLIPLRSGSGVWLTGMDGRRYLDAVSSWWVNLFGHAHPRINAAVRAQLDALPHAMFAGFTHEPAVQLAERLLGLAPRGLARCFFADNGSAAVEIALKMSFHYWRNRGQPRKTRFVTLDNSYHGETLGALAVGHVELYRAIYRPLLIDAITAPTPDAMTAAAGESSVQRAEAAAAALDSLLAERAREIAAVIVEPLVQCAGNMRMHDARYLSLARAACDRHGVHLIADEIAVGFGRTGTLFACEQAAVRPDFMCLSKSLTGGYMPMSVVLTTADVYDAFYDDYATLRGFLHSHSYCGNPLACAAALATLDVFRDEDVLARNLGLATHLGEVARAAFSGHPHVIDVRQRGMILAVEWARDAASRQPFDWRERRHLRLYRHALERGVLLRPLGHVVYFMPPYVSTHSDIERMVDVAREGLELAVAN